VGPSASSPLISRFSFRRCPRSLFFFPTEEVVVEREELGTLKFCRIFLVVCSATTSVQKTFQKAVSLFPFFGPPGSLGSLCATFPVFQRRLRVALLFCPGSTRRRREDSRPPSAFPSQRQEHALSGICPSFGSGWLRRLSAFFSSSSRFVTAFDLRPHGSRISAWEKNPILASSPYPPLLPPRKRAF